MLSYLASSELNIFMFSNKFYWGFVLLDLNEMIRKLCMSYQPFLGCHHKALPKVNDGFVSTPKAQNVPPCLGSAQCSLRWSTANNEAGSSTQF